MNLSQVSLHPAMLEQDECYLFAGHDHDWNHIEHGNTADLVTDEATAQKVVSERQKREGHVSDGKEGEMHAGEGSVGK
jgi:hypothetical protein